jgi:hypothetical protein
MTTLSERLVLIDPTDIDNPPALNLFDFGLERLTRYSRLEREKLLNGAIALYEYLFGALRGSGAFCQTPFLSGCSAMIETNWIFSMQ